MRQIIVLGSFLQASWSFSSLRGVAKSVVKPQLLEAIISKKIMHVEDYQHLSMIPYLPFRDQNYQEKNKSAND